MKTHDLRFRISQTQRAQQNALLTAILVTVFAVVTTAVAPQLLYEYVLQNVGLEQQLLVLRYLPAVSYGAALVVFVVVLFKNFFRGRALSMYEQELQLLAYTMMDEEVEMEMELEPVEPAKKASASKSSQSTTSSRKKSSSSKKKSTAKKSK